MQELIHMLKIYAVSSLKSDLQQQESNGGVRFDIYPIIEGKFQSTLKDSRNGVFLFQVYLVHRFS